MFNPCYPFTISLLEAMLAKQVRYFVRSTYTRGSKYYGEKIKEAFIISHYHSLSEAKWHYNSIPNDPHRFLYDAENADHIDRLRKLP